MDAPDPKDLDLELSRYLRRERRQMTSEECTERMKDFEKECAEAIVKAGKAWEARVKVWILGALVGMLISFIGTVVYLGITTGTYQERVDQGVREYQRLEQRTTKDIDKLEQEVGRLREILYRNGIDGRPEP